MKLKLSNIQKSFGEKQVLKDITMEFGQDKIYGLLGRNGAGKTTLFNCLSDELRPDGGSARLVRDDGSSAPLDTDDVGYVFSTPILPDFLTGREFLKFYLDINQERADPDKTVEDYFDMVSIAREDRDRLIKGYSHGMKNKLQMLGFLIARPPVVLLDEPLTSFDVVVALEIKKLLRENKQGRIILFSTHILQLATDLCDEIMVLNNGKLEQIDHALLKSGDFEERIIELLKDEGGHE